MILCKLFQTRMSNISTKAHNIPLWYNSKINISFRKEWFDKGYHNISDILDRDGALFKNEDMSSRGLKFNFLEYESLKVDISKLPMRHAKNNKLGPYLPYTLFKMGYNKKTVQKHITY